MTGTAQVRVPYDELVGFLSSVLLKVEFSDDRAKTCAQLFADATRDGVYSHGVHRFPRFVRSVRNGLVIPQASPELVSRFGSMERWNGRSGPGNLNARQCMQRAVELCR